MSDTRESLNKSIKIHKELMRVETDPLLIRRHKGLISIGESVLRKMENIELVISGDFNCSLFDFLDENKELSDFERETISDLEVGESIHIDFTEVKRIK